MARGATDIREAVADTGVVWDGRRPGPRLAALAEPAGAEVAVLPGLGHWWMIQDPIAGAAALRTFWSSID